MKLSFSNIAWDAQENDKFCTLLKNRGFSALEIAPTIIADEPFTKNSQLIRNFSTQLLKKYNLSISSMQSIWYGKTENIFNPKESILLIEYTKKIIDLASAINCHNIVFGCPKNRNMSKNNKEKDVIPFFKTIGDYAFKKDTCISLEANPTIYGTNFINTTKDAFSFVSTVNSKGLKVNVDLGTIIYNEESLKILSEFPNLVNHIHISEPNLSPIVRRPIHKELCNLLKRNGYQNYVSVEMKKPAKTDIIEPIIEYISETFE